MNRRCLRVAGPAPAARPFALSSRQWSRHRLNASRHEPFPFQEADYAQVQFMPPPFGPILISKEPRDSVFKAVLVFQKISNLALTEDAHALEVFISGDSALGIYALLNGQTTERPMALDVLWQMWQAGKQDWKLLRVAVVELRNDVFVARLFFGDPVTGEAKWDCDCRPSDATFLAMKSGAPIYVHKKVWEEASTRLRDTHAFEYIKQLHAAAKDTEPRSRSSLMSASGSAASPVASSDFLDSGTLLPISLLIRDMEEAIAIEDYASAAQIRDHPWMRMHADIDMHRSIGAYDRAKELYSLLKQRIEADSTRAAMAADGSFEARVIARARAEKQRETALRAMKVFRVVDHPAWRNRVGETSNKSEREQKS